MQFIDRPQEFLMCVPFLIPFAHWDKNAKNSLFIYADDKKTLIPTSQTHFIKLWQDFKGKRIEVSSENSLVRIHALMDGSTIHVALNNLNNKRVLLDLKAVLGNAKIQSIIQKRSCYKGGAYVFENKILKDLHNITLEIEETAILCIKLNQLIIPQRQVYEKTFYGDKLLVKTSQENIFQITIPEAWENPKSCELRISLAKKEGFKEHIRLSFNDQIYTLDMSATQGISQWYGNKIIKLTPDLIRNNNKLIVYSAESGGTISSIALKATYDQKLSFK